jgi:hypothetical protein
MNLFILFFGFSPFILNLTLAQNNTTNELLDSEEYYLIILGILIGTLIFIFISFSFLYLNNNRNFNNTRRRIKHYNNPIYPIYDIDDEFIYYQNSLNKQRINSTSSFEYHNNGFRDYEPQETHNVLYPISTKKKNLGVDENLGVDYIIKNKLYDNEKNNDNKNNLLNELKSHYLIPKY